MATFQQNIDVATIDGSRSKKLAAWVDTGAAYTWIPRTVMEELGISPAFRRRFRLANETEIERDCAQAIVRVDGSQLITICVLAMRAANHFWALSPWKRWRWELTL